MISIKSLFRDGPGPSSLYSLHPFRVAIDFKDYCHDSTTIKATLLSKIANNSDKEFTIQALKSAISPYVCRIETPEADFIQDSFKIKFEAYGKKKIVTQEKIYMLNKLGDIDRLKSEGFDNISLKDLLNWTYNNGRSIWEYAISTDDMNLEEFIYVKWALMKTSIERGLDEEGGLPGEGNGDRKASLFHSRSFQNRDFIQQMSKTMAYSMAVIEESASGKDIVAAPTAKSCGVIPGVLYSLLETYKISEKRIIRGLITSGLIGKLLYKEILEGNQYSDISIATAMAGAAATQIMGGSPKQVIAAASIPLSNLKNDKIKTYENNYDYIELNSLAANNALNNATWALLSDNNLSKEIDLFYKTSEIEDYQFT